MSSPTNGKKEAKTWERKKIGCSGYGVFEFRERRCPFSLELRVIRPSEFVGIRRKVALRDETYAWAPVLRVFDKLRDVGVSSYLSFTLYLSVL